MPTSTITRHGTTEPTVPLPAGPPVDALLDAEIAYLDHTGAQRSCPLLEADTVDITALLPHRRFPAYHGQKHFPGKWWAATTRSHVGYESWLERAWLIELDHDPAVTAIASQPFTLTWPSADQDGFTRHTPDYAVRRLNGTTVIVDCHCAPRIAGKTANRLAATATACRMLGWTYLPLGEPRDPTRHANLRWLAAYRHPRIADAGTEYTLHQLLARPRGLYAVAAAAGDPIRTLPVLYTCCGARNWRVRTPTPSTTTP